MNRQTMPEPTHPIVSREEWLRARVALLAHEKEHTRQRDELSQMRRDLPWVRVEKQYVFDAPQGKVTLADLFDGRTQLFIKHFMMGPGQVGQCVGCSLEEIEAVRRRMGWRFPWVSSYGSDFNYDFHVSFKPDEMTGGRAFHNYRHADPGLSDLSGDSVFFKDDAGRVFHTYSAYGRGGEEFLGIYRILDVMPKGRNENGPYRSLADWARPRNMYGEGGVVEGNGRFHQPACACAQHPPT